MKRTRIILLLVAVCSAMILTARGNVKRDDNRGNNIDRGDQKERMEEFLDDAEEISVTGKLELVNGELPTIESKGTTYILMAHWEDLEELELEQGKSITVTGLDIPRRLQWDDSEKFIHVTEITINGKTTEIENDENEYGPMMGGQGMPGGTRGPGNKSRN